MESNYVTSILWSELLIEIYLYCACKDKFCLFIVPLVRAISREALTCHLIRDYFVKRSGVEGQG